MKRFGLLRCREQTEVRAGWKTGPADLIHEYCPPNWKGTSGPAESHRVPCRASYLVKMFLHRPSSFRMSATSCRRAAFSFSRKPARMAIWFSFRRRASRDLLAATLFFLRRAQYLSSCSNYAEKKGWGRNRSA